MGDLPRLFLIGQPSAAPPVHRLSPRVTRREVPVPTLMKMRITRRNIPAPQSGCPDCARYTAREVFPDSFQIILNQYLGKPEFKSLAPDGSHARRRRKDYFVEPTS
jgi:hypothetical protein